MDTAEDLPFADELRAELIAARRIFGTLPQREGIKSCARFVGRGSDGGVAFVLWFNFPQAIDFDRDDEVKGVLQVGVARVAGRCRNGEIDRELPPVFPLGGMRQLDRACESLQLAAYLALSYRGSDAPPSDLSVEACLSPLLEEMLRAVHLPAGNATYRLQQVGSAAIYLLEAGTGFLTIVSAVGPLKPTKPVRQALAKGEGLVSWAALRGQPLLVNDIEHSQFHAIYQMLHPDVRHEMAVPMIVGNRIIGVLNLESGGPPFPPESVPVIMAVAAKAARACLLYEQRKAKDHEARRRNRVGELTGLMPRRPISRSTKKTWNKWSEFVCEELEGSFCAVWGRDDPPEPDAPFRKLGEYFSQEIEKPDRKKLAGIEDTPRATHGWTDFVLRTHAPVCLTSDQQKQFRPLYWRDIGGQPHWHLQPPPDAADIPNQQHPSLLQRGIKCALAIPLKSKDECFAVAWIKYLSGPVRALPASNVNDWLLAFAATMIYNLHNTKSGQVYSIQAIAPSHRSMEDLVHFPGVDLVSGV